MSPYLMIAIFMVGSTIGGAILVILDMIGNPDGSPIADQSHRECDPTKKFYTERLEP